VLDMEPVTISVIVIIYCFIVLMKVVKVDEDKACKTFISQKGISCLFQFAINRVRELELRCGNALY